MTSRPWLGWVQRLHAIARAGSAYSRDPHDLNRFAQVERVAAELVASHTGDDVDAVSEILRAQPGYLTPKVDVRAAVFDAGRILLVREKADGRWSLPGGWADVGESPSQVVAREVNEESGFDVRAVKLLAVLDMLKHDHPPQLWHVYKLFFQCELVGGAPRVSHETTAVEWFERDSLPALSLDRNTPRQIQRMFQHRDHRDWPTDFD